MIPFLFIATLAAELAGSEVQAAPQTPAPVKIILYSDFQCPYCQQFSAPFRELQTKGIVGVQTKVQFKNFPLSIHSNAQLAHQAAMAAKEQGKFYAARVDAVLEAGLQKGIRGSPTVLVNGKEIDGVPSMETLTHYVEAEVASDVTKKP